jgi:uncharacterized protein (TIGR00369 family)
MSDTRTVELERDTYERLVDVLAEDESVADVVTRVVDDHVELRRSAATYVEAESTPGYSHWDPEEHDLGMLAELPPPFSVLLGFEYVSIEPGRATMRFEPGSFHANPMGTLHGGILCDLGDAAMGAAYASTIKADESFATVELDVKYLRPVWDSTLSATARLVDGGRTVGLVECDVTDDRDRLVARLNSVCMTLRGDQADGR